MIVVTLPSASEQSQCYKLNPALRALVSGTTYCSLVRLPLPGVSSQHAFNQLWLFYTEQRNKAHHGHHPISKDPHYQ